MCQEQDQEQEIERRFNERMNYMGEIPYSPNEDNGEIMRGEMAEYGWFA